MVVGIGSKSIAGSFAEVIEHQGLRGLWAGNTVNMVRIVPTQAIEFGTFEYVKRAMTSAQERWNQTDCLTVRIGHVNLKFSLSWISPIAVAGAAAGVVSTLVCHPLEVLKVISLVIPIFFLSKKLKNLTAHFLFLPQNTDPNTALRVLVQLYKSYLLLQG